MCFVDKYIKELLKRWWLNFCRAKKSVHVERTRERCFIVKTTLLMWKLSRRCYELDLSLPREHELVVGIVDRDDSTSDDPIGETRIDVERRLMSRHRAHCGLSSRFDRYLFLLLQREVWDQVAFVLGWGIMRGARESCPVRSWTACAASTAWRPPSWLAPRLQWGPWLWRRHLRPRRNSLHWPCCCGGRRWWAGLLFLSTWRADPYFYLANLE